MSKNHRVNIETAKKKYAQIQKAGGSLPRRQGHRGLVPAFRRGRGTEHNAARQDKMTRKKENRNEVL